MSCEDPPKQYLDIVWKWKKHLVETHKQAPSSELGETTKRDARPWHMTVKNRKY